MSHNHIFQVKTPLEPGQCYSCDRIHALRGKAHVTELRNVIFGTLEIAETDTAAHALLYLADEARSRDINRYENEL